MLKLFLMTIEREEIGPKITKREVIHAIRLQKNGKSTDPDNIYVEVLKIIAVQDASGLILLTSPFNTIYSLPSDLLKSTFVAILKKSKSTQCHYYRLINLMSHLLKLFLGKCEYQMNNIGNGFCRCKSLFALKILTQR